MISNTGITLAVGYIDDECCITCQCATRCAIG